MITITKINSTNFILFEDIYHKRTNRQCYKESVSNSNLYCYVLHDEEQSYGWISVVSIPKVGISNNVYYIDEFYVVNTHQRQGYGTKLLNHIMTEFNDEEVRLYVEQNNAVAIKRYKESGFELINDAYYMIRPKVNL